MTILDITSLLASLILAILMMSCRINIFSISTVSWRRPKLTLTKFSYVMAVVAVSRAKSSNSARKSWSTHSVCLLIQAIFSSYSTWCFFSSISTSTAKLSITLVIQVTATSTSLNSSQQSTVFSSKRSKRTPSYPPSENAVLSCIGR